MAGVTLEVTLARELATHMAEFTDSQCGAVAIQDMDATVAMAATVVTDTHTKCISN